jgi:hypothetical protein
LQGEHLIQYFTTDDTLSDQELTQRFSAARVAQQQRLESDFVKMTLGDQDFAKHDLARYVAIPQGSQVVTIDLCAESGGVGHVILMAIAHVRIPAT